MRVCEQLSCATREVDELHHIKSTLDAEICETKSELLVQVDRNAQLERGERATCDLKIFAFEIRDFIFKFQARSMILKNYRMKY